MKGAGRLTKQGSGKKQGEKSEKKKKKYKRNQSLLHQK